MNAKPPSAQSAATRRVAFGFSSMNLNMIETNTDAHRAPARSAFTVEPLEARQMLSTSPDGVNPWVPYATIIGQDLAVAQYPFLNGTTVRIAVVDRGIDYNMPQLGGGIGASKTVLTGMNFRDSSGILLDDYGHGTGVAGILAAEPYTLNGTYNQGMVPNAQLIDLKQESSANIKDALDWIINNASKYNIQVVNLTDFITDVNNGAEDPQIYLPELKTLYDMGIFICTPVGNGEAAFGPGVPIDYPALSPYVMGAGGIDLNDAMFNDSRRGNGLDILGPAFNVTMTYYVKNPNVVGYSASDDNYTGTGQLVNYAKGTSWASAYTSGTAALLKQLDRTLTPQQIMNILTQSGDPVADPEQISGITSYPRLNVLKAIQLGYQVADDRWHTNYSIKRAQPITFRRGQAVLTGLKLLIGKQDVWSVTIPDTRKILVKTTYAGPTKLPLVNLINSRGQAIGAVTSRGLSITVGPGTYYLYYQPTQSLVGTYGVSVTTVSVGGTASAQTARPADATVTTSSVSTASADDVVLDKKYTSAFAG